ncbi:MAG: DUF6129 family protein [Thiobacillaceae bacterium]
MITAEILAAVYDQASAQGPSEATLQSLRTGWPTLHFTLCSEDDVSARLAPAVEGRDFNLYLISNTQHCLAFTTLPEAATGLVLAIHSDP